MTLTNHGRGNARRRVYLASAATIGLIASVAPRAALAEDIGPLTNFGASAQSSTGSGTAAKIDYVAATPQTSGPTITHVDPEPEILIANPGTPTTARDPVNITGIGQMVIDNGGGFIGLCTGTLINPRTVLFAAHCVNSRAATAYGANSGGTAIGFGFETNTRANGAGQTDELVRWLFGGTGGAGKYQTNLAQAFYNANFVVYNPLSTQPAANGFLYGDIALAGLDTPAAGIPTWALLFSPLPAPGSIGAAGTGYHVTLTGYGNNGTGQGGAAGIDFRRRAAENILGGLLSLGDFEQFLFGPTGTSNATNPQNLYWLDFDDPLRGGPGASPYDFNAFRDNALPNEGITSQGDSGGPLILDQTYARKVVIGVLSGGYNRFFSGQPANGYGTASFYQPLYLYWDYIAANNPYRYVGSLAGDANWTDPTHWITNNDPNYFIIGPNNTLVNGVPTTPGGTVIDTSGKFGQICFQQGGLSDCLDVRTGIETFDPSGHPIGTAGNNMGLATLDGFGTAAEGSGGGALTAQVVSQVSDGTQGSAVTAVLPAPTIANGLPGATNFVPNNTAGVRTTGVLPRYFDVTLAAAGTTTLSSSVTIDRLTLNGLNARLDITSAGSLTSLIDVTQMLGTLQVNGSLTSVGDFLFMTGGLNGTGTITAPYFTSVLGVISPGFSGSAGSIGTLTFNGNVVLSSGNTYRVDLGSNGSSDRIAVMTGAVGSGIANVGGTLGLNILPGTVVANNTYTIVTAQGGVTGTFAAPATNFSGVLRSSLLYGSNQVQLRFTTVPYLSVVNPNDPVQVAYASLLDGNRGQQDLLSSIYGPLDLQSASTIQSTLSSLNPVNQTTVTSLGTVQLETVSKFVTSRLENLDPTRDMGGTVSMIGQPLQLASLSLAGMPIAPEAGVDGAERTVSAGKLPDNLRVYLAGGYIDGDSAPATTSSGIGRDQFNGWYVSSGLEVNATDHLAVGLSFAYSRLQGNSSVFGQTATADLYQGSLYGKLALGSGYMLDGQFSAGLLSERTTRTGTFLGTPYTLRSSENPLSINADIAVSKDLPLGNLTLTPRIAVRAAHIDVGTRQETGAAFGLQYAPTSIDSIQARGGFTLKTTHGAFQPTLTANFVHEFNDRPGVISGNFVSGIGANALFALNSTDRNWGEVSGGFTYKGKSIDLTAAADTTFLRSDVSYQTYRGTVTIHF